MTFSRSKLSASLWLALVTTTGVVQAQGLDSHVHGNAELNIVSMDQQMQVEFVSPAINLLGFEWAPVIDEETALLDDVVTQLLNGEWLIGDALSNCQLTSNTIQTPVSAVQPHDHDADHDHASHEGNVQAHSNFHVQYLYNCPAAPPGRLRIIAFERYKGIESISVQWIAGRKQGFAQLTPGNPVLILE